MTVPCTTFDSPVGSLTAELGALVDAFRAGLTERIVRLGECGTNVELIDAVQMVERAVRCGEHAAASVVSAVETRGLYQLDGHVEVDPV